MGKTSMEREVEVGTISDGGDFYLLIFLLEFEGQSDTQAEVKDVSFGIMCETFMIL